MTPLTAMGAFTCQDSNQSSRRSAMLMVMRRVTSAMVRTLRPRLAPGQPQGVVEVRRSAGADAWGDGEEQGTEDVGQAGHPGVPQGHGLGVLLRPLGDLLVVALGVVGEDLDRAPFGEGLVVGPHGVDLVAVALELELAHDGRRQQAHHVGEPGHLELGGVGPRGLGGGRPPRSCSGPRGPRCGRRTGPGRPPRPARCVLRPPRLRRTSRSWILLFVPAGPGPGAGRV